MKNLDKVFLYILTLTLVTSGVIAFNSNFDNNPSNPVNFGHSADEMLINIPNLGEMTLQDAINQGIIGFNQVIIKNIGEEEGVTSTIHEIPKPSCPQGYSAQISTSASFFTTVGNVNSDDILGTWVIEDSDKWRVKAGDFDSSVNTGSATEFPRYDNSAKSKLSYITYCKLS